jgi:anhydro-N-acetylmuramic acid kinase
LNIGGIANLTAIPAGAAPEAVFAIDTGPGNMVMDALASIASGGKQSCDRDGKLAARGRTDAALLAELLSDAYYRRRPPRTAGREQYGTEFVERLRSRGLPLKDLLATATELTAATIAQAIHRFVEPRMTVDDLIVSGGGLHNPVLQAHLARMLPGVRIASSAESGIDPDAKEAIAFAVLAHETWHDQPSNLPTATGARHAAVLGKLQR